MVSFTNGNITATSSEQTLFDVTSNNTFATQVFIHNMTSGDAVTIRIYVLDANASTMRIYLTYNTGVLTATPTDVAINFTPVASPEYKVTLQQTAGTNRVYNWIRATY